MSRIERQNYLDRGKRFGGFYLRVYRHMLKKGWTQERARKWLHSRNWLVVLRANNFIVRRDILSAPPAELREVTMRGKVYVALRKGSSIIAQARELADGC